MYIILIVRIGAGSILSVVSTLEPSAVTTKAFLSIYGVLFFSLLYEIGRKHDAYD